MEKRNRQGEQQRAILHTLKLGLVYSIFGEIHSKTHGASLCLRDAPESGRGQHVKDALVLTHLVCDGTCHHESI